jgi:hypothetical protein
MILIAEYAFLADGIIFTLGADLLPVDEHSEIHNE